MRFDNEAEELFYDFLNDFELTSMISNIQSQVKLGSGLVNRRVDFILTLTNGETILLEVDGGTHEQTPVAILDAYKDKFAIRMGNHTLRISFKDFFDNRELVANKIEAMIDLLSHC